MRDKDREAEWVRTMARLGEFVAQLGKTRGTTGVDGGELTEFRVKLPAGERTDVLVIVKVSGEEGDVIGFVGSLDVATAMLTWRNKDLGSGLRWREDRPFRS